MTWKSEDPDEAGFLKEYAELPPRTIGLLGMALVERRLRMAIKAKWQDDPKKEMLGSLFRIEGGPIGTTGVQIDVGYAIGLYDWTAAQDLKTCAKIRNKFAHRISARDFEAQAVAALCDNLKLPGIYPVRKPRKGALTLEKVLGLSGVPDLGTRQGQFSRTVEIVITLLWGHLGFPKRLPPT